MVETICWTYESVVDFIEEMGTDFVKWPPEKCIFVWIIVRLTQKEVVFDSFLCEIAIGLGEMKNHFVGF